MHEFDGFAGRNLVPDNIERCPGRRRSARKPNSAAGVAGKGPGDNRIGGCDQWSGCECIRDEFAHTSSGCQRSSAGR